MDMAELLAGAHIASVFVHELPVLSPAVVEIAHHVDEHTYEFTSGTRAVRLRIDDSHSPDNVTYSEDGPVLTVRTAARPSPHVDVDEVLDRAAQWLG